jgi:ring-1,2-phenylacetyl-CoA epoxidase subunit PaaD
MLINHKTVYDIVQAVCDPEVPVLTIADLGILRTINISDNNIEVVITPTYTGCPAMDMIAMNIRLALIEQGFNNIKITTVLSPAWTTDWMTETGKIKLKEYGIAPPHYGANSNQEDIAIQCPQCNSYHTRLLSEFGSTACKALYQCNNCKEPFDYFKCH